MSTRSPFNIPTPMWVILGLVVIGVLFATSGKDPTPPPKAVSRLELEKVPQPTGPSLPPCEVQAARAIMNNRPFSTDGCR